MGNYRGFPDVYPIITIILPGETEGLCAELHNINNRKEGRRATLRLISLINLRVEPRALPSRTGHTTG